MPRKNAVGFSAYGIWVFWRFCGSDLEQSNKRCQRAAASNRRGLNPHNTPFKKGAKILSACIGRRSVNSKGIDRPALFVFPGKRNTPSVCFFTGKIKRTLDFSTQKVTITLESKAERNECRRKNKYFQERTLNLQHKGSAVKPETEEGLRPVEMDSQRLCLALDSGAVRYWREDAADEHRSAALNRAVSITKTTTEYISQMEAAPQLTVSGLTGDYRLLVNFNGVVLAGLYSITDEQGNCLQSVIKQIEHNIPHLGKLLDQEKKLEASEVPESGGTQLR